MPSVSKFAAALFASLLCLAGPLSAGDLVPNRLASARPGEWTLYEMPDGYVQKHTVTAREGSGPEALVAVRVDNILDGQVVESKEIRMPAGEPLRESYFAGDPDRTVTVESCRASVGGRELPATIVRVADAEGGLSEWLVSAEIPVFGLIRQSEPGGGVSYQLKDWGGE